ncbi:hypothetical protein FCF10_00280 [Lactobacillus amylovorus subsp. animalium]|uniref:hypothetical protein n=1 Tax=Lactobacillus amylovorus TaxID=1604 RepID=UPI0010ACD098|nr:hypothetical protein [Lactobacillus amylovorus]MDB6248844.1 hypothetical protein [Lactobacillus amylovorus]TJY06647.1 hypothetical protein FCF10_00280 [Lactobacillus amylovorus]
MKSIIKIILILFIGLILGICIDGFMHYKIQIPGEQFGSIADWMSGIGTIGATITALWGTFRKKPKIKLGLPLRCEYSKSLNRYVIYVTFRAFNQSTMPVNLMFYGIRKRKKSMFILPTPDRKEEYEIMKPGETLEREFDVNQIVKDYGIENCNQRIEVGFAEPDGTLYTLKFNRKNLQLKKNNLKELKKLNG